jgi:arylsulfatase A-like enzyme
MNISHISYPDKHLGLPLLGETRKAFSRREVLGLGGRFALYAGLGIVCNFAYGCDSDFPSGFDKKDYHNVVLISIDTLRADHLSCYGYFRKTSPNIDKFAEESLVFENAFSAAPITIPSHMSMFTSVSPVVHDVLHLVSTDNFAPLSPKIRTLPEILNNEGFTGYGYIGHPMWLSAVYGFGRGFRDLTDLKQKDDPGYYGYRQNLLFDKHIYEIVERKKPFFLFYHNFDVHSSDYRVSKYMYDGPPEFRDRFLPEGKEIPLDHDLFKIHADGAAVTQEELEQIIARYDGGILHADHKMGRIFDLLRENQLYDNSLIILTSDHGESLGDREELGVPKFFSHGWLYDVGLRVPLIVKFPKDFEYGGPIKGRVDYNVRTIDILPTVLDTLSIESPPYIEGENLLNATRSRVSFASIGPSYSVRTPEFSVVFNDRNRGYLPRETRNPVEVFDIQKDRQELNNLYEEDKAKIISQIESAKKMLRDRKALREVLGEPGRESEMLDEEHIQAIKDLGYL